LLYKNEVTIRLEGKSKRAWVYELQDYITVKGTILGETPHIFGVNKDGKNVSYPEDECQLETHIRN